MGELVLKGSMTFDGATLHPHSDLLLKVPNGPSQHESKGYAKLMSWCSVGRSKDTTESAGTNNKESHRKSPILLFFKSLHLG